MQVDTVESGTVCIASGSKPLFNLSEAEKERLLRKHYLHMGIPWPEERSRSNSVPKRKRRGTYVQQKVAPTKSSKKRRCQQQSRQVST